MWAKRRGRGWLRAWAWEWRSGRRASETAWGLRAPRSTAHEQRSASAAQAQAQRKRKRRGRGRERAVSYTHLRAHETEADL
eukprot:884912-Rhodomonas_salina.1